MDTILECKGLTKVFERNTVLNNVDLTLMRGRIVGLLGPNGSGKTTLLKIINGLLVPTSGEVLINGKKPGIETKSSVSYISERNSLYNWMKVKELVTFYNDFYSDFCREKALQLIENLNINSNSRLKILSKGTKEKIQLILAMSRESELYCLDEPIGGVDPASRDHIINTVLNNYDRKATILISTHLISDIESILDDVVLISEGHILKSCTAVEIKNKNGMSVDDFFRREYRCLQN